MTFLFAFLPTLNIYNALPIRTPWTLFCIGGTNIVWPKLIGDIGIGPLLSKAFTVIPLYLVQRFLGTRIEIASAWMVSFVFSSLFW